MLVFLVVSRERKFKTSKNDSWNFFNRIDAMNLRFFPRKQPQVHSINSIGKIPSIILGGSEFPLPNVKKKYDILIIGDVHIPVEVT